MSRTDHDHPADESLLALVHEQSFDDAGAIRSHLASCAGCSRRISELSARESAIAELLELVDHPLPAAAAPLPFRARRRDHARRIALVIGSAATLVAAAAAIVPDSPLHRWIAGPTRMPVATPAARRATPPAAPQASAAAAPLASGIAIPAPTTLVVVFRHDQPGGTVDITRTDSGDVTFRSRGGSAAYAVAEHRVSIDNRSPAEAYLIEIPRTVQRVRIRAGGRLLMQWPEDSGRYAVPDDPRHARLHFGSAARNTP